MTVATTPGGAVDGWGGEDFDDLGMEDIGAGELTIPRLEIDHDNAIFRDRNTKSEYPTLNAVILGVVKQRIMWDREVDDGDKPQCKAPDFKIGFPQMRTDIPKDKQFPWAKANFNKSDFEPEAEASDGQIRLPCDKCVFAEWNTNGWKNPPCNEQWTFPLLYEADPGQFIPAILTLQRSAAKACKSYITPFKSARQPMFTVLTEMTLTLNSRGKVTYSTPNFRKIGPTDKPNWPSYADDYRSIREFLRKPPSPPADEEDGGSAPKKTPASATAATKLAEDDPWATAAAPASDPNDLPF